MAKERLSKLQKWILVNTYKKTILHEKLEVVPYELRDCFAKANTQAITIIDAALSDAFLFKQQQRYHYLKEIYFESLNEHDILLNYYKLRQHYGWLRASYIGGADAEKIAIVRSVTKLKERGYVMLEWYRQGKCYNEKHTAEVNAFFHTTSAKCYDYCFDAEVFVKLTTYGKQIALELLNP